VHQVDAVLRVPDGERLEQARAARRRRPSFPPDLTLSPEGVKRQTFKVPERCLATDGILRPLTEELVRPCGGV